VELVEWAQVRPGQPDQLVVLVHKVQKVIKEMWDQPDLLAEQELKV
jgi:hypothetical protein